jgi:nucleotide-binding universal stress UspA family protein
MRWRPRRAETEGGTEATEVITVNRIVIATDGSAGGRAAVIEGLALARAFGAEVLFVSVHARVVAIYGGPYYQQQLSEALAGPREALADAMALAAEADVPAEEDLREGDAADEIVRAAKSHEADLIVVGSRGLGRVAGAILGSVSNAVVHHAAVPVLVVKQPSPADVERRQEQVVA